MASQRQTLTVSVAMVLARVVFGGAIRTSAVSSASAPAASCGSRRAFFRPARYLTGVPSRSSRDSPYAIGITDRRTGFLSHVPLQRRKMRGRQQESVAAGGGAPAALTRGFRSGTLSRVTMAAVRAGDVAEVEYSLKKDDGSPFETRFDQGRVRLLVGGGGFAPFLHKAVMEMEPGEKREVVVPPKDAFDNPELTATFGMESAPGEMSVGSVVQLWTGQKATVTEVTKENFKLDWNSPGAGTSLVMDVKVLDAAKADSILKKATFAGGCFWGLELAFQRAQGVVSTKAGYAQGFVKQPSYSDVCSGKTGHTEAVQVLYDPRDISYEDLLRIFFERHDPTQANGQGNDRGTQYRAGVYFHDEDQKQVAEAFFAEEVDRRGLKKVATELEEVKDFFDAEDEHQQYLQKGGQDARKEATETIRCYG